MDVYQSLFYRMSMNLFMYWSSVDFNNVALHMKMLTEYLASLKDGYLKKKKKTIFFTFPSFSLYGKCSLNVFAPDIRLFVFRILISYSNC